MHSLPLVEIALRVLTACTSGQHPSPDDIAILRQNASTHWLADLPIDTLASEIVKREAYTAVQQSRLDRTLALKLQPGRETA
jgi:hypothetical protein